MKIDQTVYLLKTAESPAAKDARKKELRKVENSGKVERAGDILYFIVVGILYLIFNFGDCFF